MWEIQMEIDILFFIPDWPKKRKVWTLFLLAMLWRNSLNFDAFLAVDKMDDFIVFSSPVVSIFNFLYY